MVTLVGEPTREQEGFVSGSRGLVILIALAVFLFTVFLTIALMPDLVVGLTKYLVLYASAFLLYVLSLWALKKTPDTRRVLVFILVSGALFRLMFINTWPTLSTDYYRYMWDGKVANHRINPYLYCPGSPHLEHLRDAKWHWINFRGTNTPYPPASQIVFWAAYKLGHGRPAPLKLILFLFDAITVFFVLKLLKHFGLPLNRILVYAWNPLVVMELFSSGHQDTIGTAFTWMAIYCTVVLARPMMSGVSMAASVIAKFYAIPLLPLFLRKGRVRFCAGFAVTAGLLYLPYLSGGKRVLAGFGSYASGWRVLGPIVPLTDRVFSLFTRRLESSARSPRPSACSPVRNRCSSCRVRTSTQATSGGLRSSRAPHRRPSSERLRFSQ